MVLFFYYHVTLLILHTTTGELPGHGGLWESAQETAHDLYVNLYITIRSITHFSKGKIGY